MTTTTKASLALILAACSVTGTLGQTDRHRSAADKGDYYRKWLNRDVLYIITPEEREIFAKLATPEEKDSFIEQFWARRDPDPRTAANEFQEEHYRRLRYADEHFTSGRPGWRTDRGRFYVKFGPPDDIQTHTGGVYLRRPYEGGGTTSVYPFERWRYRYIEGVGNEVEVEFVDASMSGEYRLALDADEKDALFNVVGMGNTRDEDAGTMTRSDRVRYRHYGNPFNRDANQTPMFQYRRLQDEVFYRVDQWMRLEKPPKISSPRLKELVEARVTYGEKLPLEAQHAYFRLGEDAYLVPVSVKVANRDLTYQAGAEGMRSAKVVLVARVTGVNGRVYYEFDDTLYSHYSADEFPLKDRHFSLYQKFLRLGPGRFRVTLVAQTGDGLKTGTTEFAVVLPSKAEATGIKFSSLVLSAHMNRVLTGAGVLSPFVIGDVKVIPSFDRTFGPRDEVGVYAQAYDLAVDPSTGKAAMKVRYEVVSEQGRVLREFDDDGGRSYQTYGANRLVITKRVPLLDLPRGRYTLRVYVLDELAGREQFVAQSFAVGG